MPINRLSKNDNNNNNNNNEIGDAGNLEGLDNRYYEQPKWSAFRNGTEYGYGKLTILSNKRLLWSWYINNGKQMFPRDKVLICNSIFSLIKCN